MFIDHYLCLCMPVFILLYLAIVFFKYLFIVQLTGNEGIINKLMTDDIVISLMLWHL